MIVQDWDLGDSRLRERSSPLEPDQSAYTIDRIDHGEIGLTMAILARARACSWFLYLAGPQMVSKFLRDARETSEASRSTRVRGFAKHP